MSPLYSGTLHARPPFDFEQSLRFIDGFPPTRGEQQRGPRALTRGVMVAGQPVVFRVWAAGTVVHYSAWADAETRSLQAELEDRIRFFLSLDDDLEPFYALAADDPAFAPVLERLHGLHQVKFITPFENAVWAVLT